MQTIILYILPLLLLLNNTFAVAQAKYFETSFNWYPTTANQNGVKVQEHSNGQYLIGGLVNNYMPFFWNNCSLMVDKQGQLISINEYQADTALFEGTGLYDMLPTEYGYIMAGFVNDATGMVNSLYYLVRIDTTGLLIDQTVLPPPNLNNYNNIGYSICRTADGGYLLGGYSGTQGWSNPYLCKLNADLSIEWDTLYEQYANEYSRILQIKPAKDGNDYWAIANINTTNDEGDIALLKIDDAGTIWEEYVYGQPDKKELTWKFIETLDNGFAFVVTRLTNQGSYMGGIVKTNNLNNIAWGNLNAIRTIDGGVLQLPDSTFIISGSSFKDYPPNDLDTQISKFSHDGQLLWTRHYGNEGNDYVYDMLLDSEGSLVFCGRDEAVNQPNVINGANVYLLKTNCMGLLTEPQAAFSTTIDTAALTVAFQNLSTFVYPDSIDGGHFLWDFGDGTFSSDINPTHTYAQSGSYEVTLMAVVCSDTSVFVQNICISTLEQPMPSFVYSLQSDTLVSFTNTSSNAEDAVLLWDFGDGTFSSEQNPTHAYTQAGEHEVRLSVVLCQDTTVFVQVVTTFVVGLPQIDGGGFAVYPNPARDYLVVENNSQEQNLSFVLYDVVGRVLLQQSVSTQNSIATQHLPSGVYLYHFLNPKNQILIYGKVSIVR